MAYFYTTDVEAKARLDYWRELVSNSIVPLEVRPYPDTKKPGAFDGGIEAARLADLQIVTVTAGQHQVHRTAEQIATRDEQLYCLCLQVNGSVQVSRGDRREVIGEGDMMVLDSSDRYRLTFTGDHQVACFHIPRQQFSVPYDEVRDLVGTKLPTTGGVAALMRPFLLQLARQAYGDAVADPNRMAGTVRDLTESLLLERLGDVRRDAEAPRRLLLMRIRQEIEERLASPELNPEVLAAEHRMSVAQLNKLFLSEGVGVEQWISERRLEHCRRDLRDVGLRALPLAAIGVRWGFPDPFAFERAFEERFRISPRDYRVG